MKTPKSLLNEYCTQRGLAQPVYTSTRQDGPVHAAGFKCTVQLQNGAAYQGLSVARTKRQAEHEAALAALESLGIGLPSRVPIEPAYDARPYLPRKPPQRQIQVLLDCENCSSGIGPLLGAFRGVQFVAFASLNGGHILSERDHDRLHEFVLVESTDRDAADIAMVLWIGKQGYSRDTCVLVVTGDKFGKTLVQLMNQEHKCFHYAASCADALVQLPLIGLH
jgi:hypothetical protein